MENAVASERDEDYDAPTSTTLPLPGRKLRFDFRLDSSSFASDWSDKVRTPEADDDDFRRADDDFTVLSDNTVDNDGVWWKAHTGDLPDQISLGQFCAKVLDVQGRIIRKIVNHERRDMWNALHGNDIHTYVPRPRPEREATLAALEARRVAQLPVNKEGNVLPSTIGALSWPVPDQRRALLGIRESARLSSPLWGWSLEAHYCSWAGVKCDGRGHVVKLELSEMDMHGRVPSHLSRLESLQSLDMSGNAMTGPLPHQLSVLAALDTLDLARNQLEGSLPVPWSALTSLAQLDLRGNTLEGMLPSQWSSLGQLRDLDLSRNKLSGPLLPDWSSLTSLEYLDVSNNALSGEFPATWRNLAQMRSLRAQGNQISGEMPLCLARLRKLRTIALQGNRLQGRLLPHWAALANLEYMNLESNQLTGLLPIQWSRLTNLQHLVINNNAVKGELPREWSGLAMLHRLEATNNALTGQVPGEWKGLKYLNYLALEGNHLRGPLSESTIHGSVEALYGPRFNLRDVSFIPFE